MSETIVPNPLKAKMFAEVAHANQVYADEVPYPYHLSLVVGVLKEFGFDDPLMECCGWLHDVIEDTNRSYNDIKEKFGRDVAEIVYCVTNELGRNRAERNTKTYPKIADNKLATALKLADRIANVRYSMANGGKQDMYAKEFPGFYSYLYRETGDERIERMWNYLKKLIGSNA